MSSMPTQDYNYFTQATAPSPAPSIVEPAPAAPSDGGLLSQGAKPGFGEQLKTFLTGGYDPTNMLMKKLGVPEVPAWARMLQNSSFSVSGKNGWFGYNPQLARQGRGQDALLAALMGAQESDGKGPVQVANASSLTPLGPPAAPTEYTPYARRVSPVRYDADSLAGRSAGPSFMPLTPR